MRETRPTSAPYFMSQTHEIFCSQGDKLREHVPNWHGPFESLRFGCHRGLGNRFRTEEQLLSHSRTAHNDQRSHNHCQTSNTLTAGDRGLLDEHFESIHGDYECEVGPYGQSHSSKLIPNSLKKHLVQDHRISYHLAVDVVDALVEAGECALKDWQLARLGWIEVET